MPSTSKSWAIVDRLLMSSTISTVILAQRGDIEDLVLVVFIALIIIVIIFLSWQKYRMRFFPSIPIWVFMLCYMIEGHSMVTGRCKVTVNNWIFKKNGLHCDFILVVVNHWLSDASKIKSSFWHNSARWDRNCCKKMT